MFRCYRSMTHTHFDIFVTSDAKSYEKAVY